MTAFQTVQDSLISDLVRQSVISGSSEQCRAAVGTCDLSDRETMQVQTETEIQAGTATETETKTETVFPNIWSDFSDLVTQLTVPGKLRN